MKVLARSAALLAGFAAALLALLGVGGAWVRPAADDWCYQTNMRTMSVRQFVHFLYQDSNGRAGNAVLLAWVHGLGPLGLQIYPVVVIALLLGSLWLLIARLTRLAGRHVPVAVQLLTAATASLAFLLVCPQPYQTTYWASGGISHTVPAVLTAVLVSTVLCLPGRTGRAGLAGRWTAALALLLGFAFIALVSEAMALVVGVLAAVLWLRAGDVCADRPARRAARLGALAAIAGSAGGLLVEYLSPGMHARSAGLGVPHGAELLHRLREGVVTWVGDLATTVTSFDYVAVVLAGVVLGLTTRRLTADAPARTGPDGTGPDGTGRRVGAFLPLWRRSSRTTTDPARPAEGAHGDATALALGAGNQSVLHPARAMAAGLGGGEETATSVRTSVDAADPATAQPGDPGPGPEDQEPSTSGGASADPRAHLGGASRRREESTATGHALTGMLGAEDPAGSQHPGTQATGAAAFTGTAGPGHHPGTGPAEEREGPEPRVSDAVVAPALAVRSPLRLLLWAAAGVLLGSLLVTELVQAVFGSWIWYMVRTWNDWRLPYTLLLAAVGVAAGRLLASALAPPPGAPITPRRRRAVLLLPALLGLALLGLAQPAVAVVHQTRVRAHHWDAQQVQLEAQVRAGVKSPTYVPSYIGHLRDAYTRSGRADWVASCIDDYYGTHIRLPAHSTDWVIQSQNAPIP
ncbi:hypothetical protein [Streptacidiphilus anmyonensis]|uniref:hypothetical protein n=1 Tax=Streptacidiphilus anmyonensis TaxID=405782 RepID=UPI0005A85F9E|nr:hypothetical protein [Streptacidiphilus anmyonensis]